MTRRMIDMFKRESDVARFPKLRRCVFCSSEKPNELYPVGILYTYMGWQWKMDPWIEDETFLI